MDLSKLLAEGGMFEQLAGQFGIDPDTVENVVKTGLPKLSNAINENTSEEGGLESFMKALKDHKDDDVETMIKDVNKVDSEDGAKILGHILGDKKETVQEEISQAAGINPSAVSGILANLAPILMGMLGKGATAKVNKAEVAKEENSLGNLGGLLDSFLGQDSNVVQSATSFLDANKDGNIMDDIMGKLFGKN